MPAFSMLALICVVALAGSLTNDGAVAGDDHHVSGPLKRSDDVNPLETLVLVQQQAAALQQQTAALHALEARIQTLQQDMDRMKSSAAKSVSFLVHYSQDPVDNIGVHATLIFDAVTYNLGEGYSPLTGIFTAPTPGLYAFFVSMMSSDTNDAVDVYVVKEGIVLEGVWAQGKSDLYDQGSTMLAIHLNNGERVWVKHGTGAPAVRGGEYTIFSGFLVHPDL